MRHNHRFRLLLVSLFILFASFTGSSAVLADSAAQINQAYIAGWVVDEYGAGMSGVSVTAYNTATLAVASAVFTDAGGFYQMLVNPGTYRLTANKTGYLLQYYSGVYSYADATDVIVGVGEYVGEINFALIRGLCINGYIAYPDGSPAFAAVYAYRAGNPPDASYYDATYYGMTNARDGRYSVCDLTPGQYRLEARDQNAGYPNTFYLGARTAANAALVAAGSNLDVNFRFLPDNSQSYITGRVVDADGDPIHDANVTAYNTANYAASAVFTDGNGYFMMLADPGTYRLTAEKAGYVRQYYAGAYSYGAATDVPVGTNATTSGIDFALGQPGCIYGSVAYPNGSPANATLYAYRAGINSNTSYYDATYYSAAPEGWFSLCDLAPGKYRVEARDNNHIYPNTFFWSALTATDADTLTVPSGGYAFVFFNFIAPGNQAFINGRVVDTNSIGVGGVTVTAYDTANYSVEASVFTDANGYYSLLVDPATYRVSAEKPGYLTQYYAHSYNYADATDVAVGVAQTVRDINLTLTQPGCISGRITDPYGDPVAAYVYAYRAGMPAETSYYDATYYGTANSDGIYHICNLTPGQYRVMAQDFAGQYRETFAGHVPNAADATLLIVHSGEMVNGIDIAFLANAPAAPRLIAPTGMQGGSPGAYSWYAVPDASWYYLWVSDQDGTVMNQWYDGWYICTGGGCNVTIDPPLASGNYTWWVQAWGATGGYSEWSAPAMFAVPFTGSPTPIEPIGVAGETVVFNWTQQPGAQWYNLWVSDPDGVGHEFWYDAWNVCAGTECSSPAFPVDLGTYRWWIRSWNAQLGGSAWSAEQQFARPLPAPTPVAPLGTVTTATPNFQWNALPGGDWYYVWISGPAGYVADVWYNGYEICAGGVCSVPSPATLTDGSYRWWVSSFNAVSGYGAWSGQSDFTVAVALPEAQRPLVVMPEMTDVPQPTITP